MMSLFGVFGKKGNKEDSSSSEPTPLEMPKPNLYPSLDPNAQIAPVPPKSSLPYMLVSEAVEATEDNLRPVVGNSKPKQNDGSDPLQSIPVTLVEGLDSINLDSLDYELGDFSKQLFVIIEVHERPAYDYDFSLEKRILKEEQQVNAYSD